MTFSHIYFGWWLCLLYVLYVFGGCILLGILWIPFPGRKFIVIYIIIKFELCTRRLFMHPYFGVWVGGFGCRCLFLSFKQRCLALFSITVNEWTKRRQEIPQPKSFFFSSNIILEPNSCCLLITTSIFSIKLKMSIVSNVYKKKS